MPLTVVGMFCNFAKTVFPDTFPMHIFYSYRTDELGRQNRDEADVLDTMPRRISACTDSVNADILKTFIHLMSSNKDT